MSKKTKKEAAFQTETVRTVITIVGEVQISTWVCGTSRATDQVGVKHPLGPTTTCYRANCDAKRFHAQQFFPRVISKQNIACVMSLGFFFFLNKCRRA
jgi:hypothetical protein